jgi:F0F1-type ATP synthase membrane subunit b/b'
VLTAQQKEELKELRSERRELVRDRLAQQIANLRELNLTEQQQESLMKIRQEFHPKIKEAGDRLRSSVREEVGKIVTVIQPTGVVAERAQRVE